MQTLQRFWHWHDSETKGKKPDLARAMLDRNVSEAGRDAVDVAAGFIDVRANAVRFGARPYIDQALAEHPEALRDLSLALCPALERMRQQVPGAPPEPERIAPASPTPREIARVAKRMNDALADLDAADAMAYATQAPRHQHIEITDCRYHGGNFYGGCMHCHQSRIRAQNAERLRTARNGGIDRDPLRNRVLLTPASVRSMTDADRLRGSAPIDWILRDDRQSWRHDVDRALLRYLVVEVLAPSGGTITAEDPILQALPWWPKKR